MSLDSLMTGFGNLLTLVSAALGGGSRNYVKINQSTFARFDKNR